MEIIDVKWMIAFGNLKVTHRDNRKGTHLFALIHGFLARSSADRLWLQDASSSKLGRRDLGGMGPRAVCSQPHHFFSFFDFDKRQTGPERGGVKGSRNCEPRAATRRRRVEARGSR